MGTSGAPEGVLTAAAMHCLNGEIFGRLVIDTPETETRARAMGITDFERVYRAADLASGTQTFFAEGAQTTSMVMQLHPHCVHFIDTIHMRAGADAPLRF